MKLLATLIQFVPPNKQNYIGAKVSQSTLVIHVSREQSLDKILGFIVNKKFEFVSDARIVVVFEPEFIHNRQDRISGYYSELATFADKVIVINNSKTSWGIHQTVRQACRDSSLVDGSDYLASFLCDLRESGGKIYALVRWNEKGTIFEHIVLNSRKSGGIVFRYFKSLHDKGFGVTSTTKKLGAIGTFLALIKPLWRFFMEGEAFPKERTDQYWCYDRRAADNLRKRGIPARNIEIVNYPLATELWSSYAKKRAREIGLPSSSNGPLITIFTTGPVPGRLDDDENQTMSSSLLLTLIKEIKFALDIKFPQRYAVLAKPHPNQSVEGLSNVLELAGWSSAAIVHEGSAFLIAVSDIVVTLYSSVCVEAAYQGVDVVDYYRPTPRFHEEHPLGIPWTIFGVPLATNHLELLDFLAQADGSVKNQAP